ncbi:MAG: N-acetylglucosaminidase, partial [Agathobacter sp.]
MRGFNTQRKHRWLSICIIFAMLIGISNGHGYLTFAYEEQSAMIRPSNGNLVETKAEPSDTAAKQNGLSYGKPVTVVEEVTDAEGVLWYKLTYNLKAGGTSWGYCHAEDVLLDKDIWVYAYGIINATEVSIRDDAGTDRTNILIQVDTGTEVEMLDETSVDGKTWYRVRYTAPDTVDATTGEKIPGKVYIGWTYGSYVTLDRYNVEVDPAYVEELIAKGFPESYTQQLGVLHALYPEWIFEPVLTGLKWKDVINGETLKADGSSRPINMIANSYDDSMKSTHPDDYNWETNTWTIYDGNKWVAVHPDYLAYIMDPRNFFTETYIFQFESLSYSEAHTIEGVKAVIGSSFMSKDAVDSDGSMFNYATAFMSIGKEVGVSPYHLVSRVLQEQGSKGTSSLISGTYSGYEGYYNYFNFGASGVTNEAVIKNGLNYAKNQGWDTRYKALCGGAEKIAKNYIARGQDTLYFQKFNVVWKDMLYGHQYMGAVLAPSSEAKSIAKAYTDKHQAFVFRIPVYEEMPETAVQFTPTGNPNNYLSN